MRTALLLSIILLAVVPGVTQGAPTAWEIDDTVTFEGAPLVLAQDIIVHSGGVLHLKGVDAVVASDPLRPLNITVEAGGALRLTDGVSATSGATTPTRVTSPLAGFDLYIAAGGALLVENATIINGRLAIASSAARITGSHLVLSAGTLRIIGGAPQLEGGIVEGSPGHLLTVEAGVLSVNDTHLQNAGGAAAFVYPNASLDFARVLVGQTGDFGVRVEAGAFTSHNSTWALSPEYALYGRAANVTLVGNAWHTHCGAFLVEGSSGRIANNTFATSGRGVSLWDSPTFEVDNNTFQGTEDAITLQSSSANVHGNQIRDSQRGIVIAGGSPAVDNNTFQDNGVGIDIMSSRPAAPTLRDNAFSGHSIALRNARPNAIDARENWWGATAGPNTSGADTTQGPALLSPWRTTPP